MDGIPYDPDFLSFRDIRIYPVHRILYVSRKKNNWQKLSHKTPRTNTPRKINMEPENHPIEKENHLPNHPFSGSMLIFQGVHFWSLFMFFSEAKLWKNQHLNSLIFWNLFNNYRRLQVVSRCFKVFKVFKVDGGLALLTPKNCSKFVVKLKLPTSEEKK